MKKYYAYAIAAILSITLTNCVPETKRPINKEVSKKNPWVYMGDRMRRYPVEGGWFVHFGSGYAGTAIFVPDHNGNGKWDEIEKNN